MAGQRFRRDQAKVVLEPLARIAEQAVEYPTHGEDRGTGIDGKAAAVHPAHLAADMGGAFDDGDVKSLPGEIGGGGQAAHPGPDDNDLACHVNRTPQRGAGTAE